MQFRVSSTHFIGLCLVLEGRSRRPWGLADDLMGGEGVLDAMAAVHKLQRHIARQSELQTTRDRW